MHVHLQRQAAVFGGAEDRVPGTNIIYLYIYLSIYLSIRVTPLPFSLCVPEVASRYETDLTD